MKKLLKRRSHKAGLLPGSLVHIGEVRQAASRIEVISYSRELVDVSHPDLEKECPLPLSEGFVSWVNLEGLGRMELLKRLGDCYSIHPLELEDIANTDQRPKAEEYEKVAAGRLSVGRGWRACPGAGGRRPSAKADRAPAGCAA